MDTKKEKMHPFFKILIIFFIIFIGFYIALESGYYPSRVRRKTLITSKNIETFENDVKKGNVISAGAYIDNDEDYSNIVTKTGNKLTYSLGKLLTNTLKGFNKTLKVLFW